MPSRYYNIYVGRKIGTFYGPYGRIAHLVEGVPGHAIEGFDNHCDAIAAFKQSPHLKVRRGAPKCFNCRRIEPELKQINLMLSQVGRMGDPRIDDDLITEAREQLAKVITHLKDGC